METTKKEAGVTPNPSSVPSAMSEDCKLDPEQVICSRCLSDQVGKDEPYHFCKLCGDFGIKRGLRLPHMYPNWVKTQNRVTDDK